MKLKQAPEDFQVEELPCQEAGTEGDFAWYRLEKSGWTTVDALAQVQQRWGIASQRVSYAGLKDRHAQTIQYLSILHGPKRNLQQQGIRVSYLGQIGAAYTSEKVLGNRFRITLRDVLSERVGWLEQRLDLVRRMGVPNYFDDQRFGSVSGPKSEWIARLLVLGRFEEALQQAMTAAYAYDRAEQKRQKQMLRKYWGQWERLRRLLPRGPHSRVVEYLVHRGEDFKGAMLRWRPELRGLYLSAYQSHLWNQMLARWLREHMEARALEELHLRTGSFPLPVELPKEVEPVYATLRLPLPSARWKPTPGDPHVRLAEAVLEEEGLKLEQLQVRGVRELFFSRGERAARCMPWGWHTEWGDDERHAGKKRLTLGFDLPRGSYATLVIKAAGGKVPEREPSAEESGWGRK